MLFEQIGTINFFTAWCLFDEKQQEQSCRQHRHDNMIRNIRSSSHNGPLAWHGELTPKIAKIDTFSASSSLQGALVSLGPRRVDSMTTLGKCAVGAVYRCVQTLINCPLTLALFWLLIRELLLLIFVMVMIMTTILSTSSTAPQSAQKRFYCCLLILFLMTRGLARFPACCIQSIICGDCSRVTTAAAKAAASDKVMVVAVVMMFRYLAILKAV